MIQREPIDRRDLHQLLHSRQPMHGTLELTLQEQPDQDVATITAQHAPGQSVSLPASRARHILRLLLAHYPVPVTVNGELMPRSDFDTLPSIDLVSANPPILPAPGEPNRELLTATQPHAGTLLFDGLFYYVAQPWEITGQHKTEQDLTSLQVTETIACSNPDWCSRHIMPAQRYTIAHNVVHQATNEERATSTFVEIIGTIYCVPGPASVEAMQPQLESPRRQVAEHADTTGRVLLGSSWNTLTRAWHPGYQDLRLLVSLQAMLVKPSPQMPNPIRWALAEALLTHDHHSLVPVSDSDHTDLWLEAARINVRTQHGNQYTLPCGNDLPHELRKLQPDLRRFMPVASITIDCQIRRDGEIIRKLPVPLDLLPTGWIDTPLVFFTPDAAQDTDALAHRMARAYNRWRAEDDHYPDTLQAAQVLAKRMTQGERQSADPPSDKPSVSGNFATPPSYEGP